MTRKDQYKLPVIIFEDGDGGEPNLTERAVNGVRSRPHRGDAVSRQRAGNERLRLLLLLLRLLYGEILQRKVSYSGAIGHLQILTFAFSR